MNTPQNTEQLLLHALTELYNSLESGTDVQANKAKAAMMDKCPEVEEALSQARLAIDMANESKQVKQLNIHPSKVWETLYPMYAKQFLLECRTYEDLANIIGADFDLTDKQWEEVFAEWEFKENVLTNL